MAAILNEITEEQYLAVKALLAKVEANERVKGYDFLAIYNRVTGRKESSTCSSCWKRRKHLLQLHVNQYEKALDIKEDEAVDTEEADEEKIELTLDIKKEEEPDSEEPVKKRGRPAGSKNKK